MSFERNAKEPLADGRFETQTSGSGGGLQGSYIARHLDVITDWAVAFSTVPFLFLMIPQIITNFQTPDEIGKLAWAGTASGGLGNLLLATFFTGGGELKQAGIQAIGAFTNMFVVAQIFMYKDKDGKHGVPVVPFMALMAVMVVGLLMPLFHMCGVMRRPFKAWVKITTVIGMSSFFFSLTNQVVDTWHLKDDDLVIRGIATALGFVVGIVLLATGRATDSVGGILATALFMFMPVPQVVGNLTDPVNKLAKFNVGFIYLGTLGNGLGMSRAIFTRNWVWLVGAAWGCYVGGVVLAITCVIGSRAMPQPVLSPASEALLLSFMGLFILYTLVFLRYDREAQKMKHQSDRQCATGSPASSNFTDNFASSNGIPSAISAV